MPKFSPEDKLRNQLSKLDCKLVGREVYCQCGANLKAYWVPEAAKDLKYFKGIDADREIVSAVLSCVKYLLPFHRQDCNNSRRRA